MNTNLTILRENVELLKESQMIHMARLAAVRDTKAEPLSDELVTLARNSRFMWSVSAKKLCKRFKYHANVRGLTIRNRISEMPVYFTGDIPDFALERAELAIKLGMKHITVHSATPLAGDPVMVGWFDYPLTTGFVLAVWKNDIELEVLGNDL